MQSYSATTQTTAGQWTASVTYMPPMTRSTKDRLIQAHHPDPWAQLAASVRLLADACRDLREAL